MIGIRRWAFWCLAAGKHGVWRFFRNATLFASDRVVPTTPYEWRFALWRCKAKEVGDRGTGKTVGSDSA